MNKQAESIYFVGIGGMGMCPLAIYLAEQGYIVSGMDDALRADVRTFLHNKKILIDESSTLPYHCQSIVFSSAIDNSHPIIQQALSRNIPCFRRGNFLSKVLKEKLLIAIVGSHGKTTTTAMLIHTLRRHSFDFSYFLGALFSDPNLPPAHFSNTSPWVIAEIDESDGTIDQFYPEISLVVNFDWDHPTHYPSVDHLKDTFGNLFKRTRRAIFVPTNCPTTNALISNTQANVYSYGTNGDYSGISSLDSFGKTSLKLAGLFPSLEINIPNGGLFNAHNGLAALSITHFLQGSLLPNPLASFKGIKRRQEYLFECPNFRVIMDYAHHPQEITPLIDYFRTIYKGSCIAVFQPHRFSRTKIYAKEFADSLSKADNVLLLPVYSAFETFDPNATSQKIAAAFQPPHRLIFIDKNNELFEHLPKDNPQDDTTVLFIGAGDIELLALEYQRLLIHRNWWKQVCSHISPQTKRSEAEPLAPKTTLRLGGPARYYAEPETIDDLVYILKTSKIAEIPLFVLGRGSNLVVPDEGFNGIVVRLNHPSWREIRHLDSLKLWVGAGVRLKELCGFAKKNGFAGFEFLEGIPGSLGGALRMNAGAMRGELYDIVDSLTLITFEGEIKKLSKDQLTISYRSCKNLHNAIAIGAILKGRNIANSDTISQKINEFSTLRKSSQPKQPSAGCIFKNPQGNHAGKLIQEAGLSGYAIGDAQVSTVHCNFIINNGKATSNDVIKLITDIRNRVYQRTNITLEPEVLFLGKDWNQELDFKKSQVLTP